MKRLLIALALVGGVAVSCAAHAAPQRPHVLTHVPASTTGPRFEPTYSTNYWWEADDWNMIYAPEAITTAAAWVVAPGNVTGVAADGPFPGTEGKAIRVTADTTPTVAHAVTQIVVTPSGPTFTYSVYAKWVAGNQWVTTRIGANYCPFNIVTGAAAACVNGGTGRIESAGNGWWRISTTAATVATSTATYLALINATGTSMTFSGDGVTSAIFYGPQLVRDTTWHAYWQPPQPSVMSNPDQFNVATTWTVQNSGGQPVTVTPDVALAPDGTMTADLVSFSAVAKVEGSSSMLRNATPHTSVSATTHTFSVWARMPSGTGTLPMAAYSGGVYFMQTVCPVTTTWTLCSVTGTSPSGQITTEIGGFYSVVNGVLHDVPAQSIYLWGARFTREDHPATTFTHVTPGNVTTTTAAYPAGFSATSRFAFGPFTGSSNRLTYQGGQLDVGDLYDFRTCVAFTPLATPTTQGLIGDGNIGAVGHQLSVDTSGSCFTIIGNVTIASVEKVALGGPNVCCYGRQGTTGYLKLNNAATVTGVVTNTFDIARAFYVGGNNAGTNPSTQTFIHGLIVDNNAWTDAWATKQIDRFLGRVDAYNMPLTVSRSTSETYVIPSGTGQTLWNAAPGTPATGPDGIGVFRAATNYAQQSETTCVAAAVQAPWAVGGGAPTCTTDSGAAPDGTTTMDRWTSALAPNYILQNVTLPSTASAVASAWFAKPSGGTTATLMLQCTGGTMNTCTCATSDNSACSAATLTTNCNVRATALGTTPVRVMASGTCAAATTTWALIFNPDNYTIATGVADVWGAQIEPGPYVTPYKKTTTAAVASVAALITTPNKLAPLDATWCVTGVWTPFFGRVWSRTDGVIGTLWSAGTTDAANSARVEVDAGNLVFKVVNGSSIAATQSYALGALTGSRTVRACVAHGQQVLYLDGTEVARNTLPLVADWATVPPGAWTSAPTAWVLGARGDNSAHWEGSVRDFRVENNVVGP